MLNSGFEIVYTVHNYYDGPREGIANFQGTPHYYQSEFDYEQDEYAATFLLIPIDKWVFDKFIDDWQAWRQWETAYFEGKAEISSHPKLVYPEVYEEQEKLIKDQQEKYHDKIIKVAAIFQKRDDPDWSGVGMTPLQVAWMIVE